MRTDAGYRLNRELETHQVFLAQLAEAADGDEELLRDLVEGETGILELIQKLDEHIVENEMIVDGAKVQIEKQAKRKTAAENRIKRFKDAVKSAMELAQLKSHRTTIGQFVIAPAPIKAIVLEESEVPSKWWKPKDPEIDRGGLTAYFRNAKKAADLAAKIDDEAERDAALAKVEADFPSIPGVSVSAGATQISRR